MKIPLRLLSPLLLPAYTAKVKFNFKKLPRHNNLSVTDFHRFIAVASVTSSQIEGSTIDVNSYFRQARSKNDHEVKDIENLIAAYRFASENELTHSNFLKAHRQLAKGFLDKVFLGKVRQKPVFVADNKGAIIYVAAEPDTVSRELKALFADIEILLSKKLTRKEAFYYASQIHFWLAKIHPFMDGNGRAARLLEKWFLSQCLGKSAWSIPSEVYYWENRPAYYKNLAKTGNTYQHTSSEKSLDFLLMLPAALQGK